MAERLAVRTLQSGLFPGHALSRNGPNGRPAIESYEVDEGERLLVRRVRLRDGNEIESVVPADSVNGTSERDWGRAYDQEWLRLAMKPSAMQLRADVRVVDLFSGCGGMTLGVAEACRALGLRMVPLLAVDVDDTALEIFENNFPGVDARRQPVEELLDGKLGATPTRREQELRDRVGDVDLIVAGPPCQGSSNLNNHTRRRDPKNALYSKVARAVEVLRPAYLIVENVLGIRHDTNGVYQHTWNHLENELTDVRYSVDGGIIRSQEVGVAQSRHRVFLVASREHSINLEQLVAQFRTAARDFAWACADLADATEDESGYDAASTPAPATKRRIDHLFDNDLHNLPDDERPPCHRNKDHSYISVYGRMWNDQPAPTITTGFTAMGQGRFVHPTRRRTITPHEAARLQFFPDYFRFGEQSRATYKRLIGNAVPPKLTYVVAVQLLR